MAGLRNSWMRHVRRDSLEALGFFQHLLAPEHLADDQPIQKQANEGHRTLTPDEVKVSQTGERANQHILRVPGDGGDAADVGRSRHGKQVWQRFQSHAARSEKCERNHDQADDVIDEKRRERAGDEDDGGQQVARLQTCDDLLRNPIEKACQAQASDYQHHGEQQHQRAEVDEAQCFSGRNNAKGDHQHGADDCHGGTIDLHARQLAQSEN